MTKCTDAEKQQEYQDAYWLREAAGWRWVTWRAPHPGWNHDHCVFCHRCDRHFCDGPNCTANPAREGWRWDDPEELDNYEMVCADCFDDLKDTFGWTVAKGPG